MRKRSELKAVVHEDEERIAIQEEPPVEQSKPVPFVVIEPPATTQDLKSFLSHESRSVRFQQIVEKIFDAGDPLEEYERLEKELVLGDQRSEYGAVRQSLDRAEDNARLAHKLYLAARAERKAWEADHAVTWASMRQEAQISLEAEKECKVRTKQITDADLEARQAILYPDEYKHGKTKAEKMKGMEDHIEHLKACWMSRCASLRCMLETMRH